MATKHMNAAPGDFAETVLMPGDPLRAQYIADTYIDDARRVTDVRNMWGFTGEYKGQPMSVMSHGMGIPSASIYCSELISDYGVKRIMRVGSCGTSHADVKLRDIIIAQGASTDSNVNRIRFGGYDLAALASFGLVLFSEQPSAKVTLGCGQGRRSVSAVRRSASTYAELSSPGTPLPFLARARHLVAL